MNTTPSILPSKVQGPYSPARLAGDLLFVSGQIPIDFATGKIESDTFESQMKQVLFNLQAVLAEWDLTLDAVVKTEVYLKDLTNFSKMNQIYLQFFTGPSKPARQAMEVARLPMDALVEISCVAYKKQN